MHVIDDFAVKTVYLKIENPDNSLVEERDATANPNGLDYTYTATQTNATVAGDKITITRYRHSRQCDTAANHPRIAPKQPLNKDEVRISLLTTTNIMAKVRSKAGFYSVLYKVVW